MRLKPRARKYNKYRRGRETIALDVRVYYIAQYSTNASAGEYVPIINLRVYERS